MRRLLAVAALLLVAGCGAGSSDADDPRTTARPGSPGGDGQPSTSSPPAAAVETMMRALDAGDCRAMRRIVVTPSAVDCEVVRSAKDTFADEGIDLDQVDYTAGEVTGGSAVVTISWGDDLPEESYDVEKVRGRWLVVFDSAA